MLRHPVSAGLLTRLLPALLLCLFAATPVPAATFMIINLDGAGEGFNDPTPVNPVGGNNGTTLGQQRLNLFQKAADIWGAAIKSSVPIRIQVSFDPLTCSANSAVLGSAGATYVIRDFSGAPKPGTWYHPALANAIAGVDLSPADDDISATFNSAIDNNNNCLSGINWYLGYDHNHGNDIDLLVVLLHEFAHGLGFSGFTNLTNGTFLLGYPDIYSHFTLDNSSGKHWDEMSSGQRRNSATNTGNVVWDGPTVLTSVTGFLTGGTDTAGHARLYAPNPVQSGSSISHFDTAASPNLLMEPYITPNLGSDLDLTDEQLFDVGWTPADTDGDGIPNSADLCPGTPSGQPVDANGCAESQKDDDGDGVFNDLDLCPGTGTAQPVDSDGCSDFQKDADEDGLSDGLELALGTDPALPDTDGDGLSDYREVNWDHDPAAYTPGADLDPLNVDTDNDGFRDGLEITAGYDPLNEASFPVWGDINDDRIVDTADVLLASRAVLGLVNLDDAELARGKVAPLVNGTPRPTGNDPLSAADLLLIERKALGAIAF